MGFKSDIEIAQECVLEPIVQIAERAGIDEKYLEQYPEYEKTFQVFWVKPDDGARFV